MKKIIILFTTIFLLSGCSYMDLEDLAIISAIGVDYDNDKFKLSAQVMDTGQVENGSMEEKSIIYESEGETIAKAIRNFSEKYPKNVYFGHLEVTVLGKDIVKNKISDTFDYFMRSPEVRSSGFILISEEDTARKILEPQNEKPNSFASEQLKSSLEGATKRNGSVNDITFEEFLSNYLQKGIDPVVPLIKLNENQSENKSSKTTIENLAVVKNNSIKKSLNDEQSIAYNTINNKYYDIVITPKHDGKPFGALLLNPKSKMDVKIENNKLNVNIKIKVETKLNELDEKIDPTNPKIRNSLNSEIKGELKKYIKSLINYCKDEDVDVLGIGNMIYKNYYKDYDKYKDKNLYDIANFNISIDSKMYRFGKIRKGAA